MEPVEALRMLVQFGNQDVITIVNPRPMSSVGIAGEKSAYPPLDKLMEHIKGLSTRTLVVDTTEEARKLGNPILANVILVRALFGASLLPLDRQSIEPVLRERFPKAFEANTRAFKRGLELV